MADLAIEAAGLGKSYTLRGPVARYATLRDTIRDRAKRLVGPRKARAAVESFWALRDVSFAVPRGQVVGIVGRNGAGKSTLLKILSRITRPEEGEVKLWGRVGSLLEVGTGFHPELSGQENIFLSGAILGMRREEIRRKFDDIVAFAEIGPFLSTPAKHYSSGMYMRLAFAVAAHLDPEILVVDEVLAVGDAQFQKKCLGKMGEVAAAGRTVLLVSHNMAAISALCERGIVLDRGHVICDAPVAKAVAKYLEVGSSDSPVVDYAADTSKEIQIRKVRLLDHDRTPSRALDIAKPFTVEVTYEVHQPVSGAVVGVNVLTSMNDSVIATCDHDLDRSKLGTRAKGLHTTSVQVPGQLLNSGTFVLVIGISVPGKHIYDRQEVMQFDLVDNGSFVVAGGGEARRNALLLLALPWES